MGDGMICVTTPGTGVTQTDATPSEAGASPPPTPKEGRGVVVQHHRPTTLGDANFCQSNPVQTPAGLARIRHRFGQSLRIQGCDASPPVHTSCSGFS